MGKNKGQGPHMRGLSRTRLRSDRREFQGGLGVRYAVADSNELSDFLYGVAKILSSHIPEVEQVDVRHGRSHYYSGFKIYDDPWKMAINVAEHRVSGAAADCARRRWGMNDVGRLKGTIEDELGLLRKRHDKERERLELPTGVVSLRLARLALVGDQWSRKFALMAEPDDPRTAFFTEARDIVEGILGAETPRLKNKKPELYTPQLMVARINRVERVSSEQFETCLDAVGKLAAGQQLEVVMGEQQIFDYSQDRSGLQMRSLVK
jgi:hypothetical protein